MEWLTTLLISDNFWKAAVGIGALITLLATLAKKGLISFKGKGLSVGTADSERMIVRNQIEFCKVHTENLANMLLEHFYNVDEWRVRYACELVFDIWVEAISFNHITKDSFYEQNKFEKVWSVLQKESFDDDTIKESIENECKKVVERLVDIKEYYSKS